MKGNDMTETHFLRADRLIEQKQHDDRKRRVMIDERYRAEKALLGEIWKNVLEEELISVHKKQEELIYELSLPPKLEIRDGLVFIPLSIIIEFVYGDVIEVSLSYDSEKNLNRAHKISHMFKCGECLQQDSVRDVKIYSAIGGVFHLIPFGFLPPKSKDHLNNFINKFLSFYRSYFELEKKIKYIYQELSKNQRTGFTLSELPYELERNIMIYAPKYNVGFLLPEETTRIITGDRTKDRRGVLYVDPETAGVVYLAGRADAFYGWVSEDNVKKKTIYCYLVHKEKNVRPLLKNIKNMSLNLHGCL